jgi:CRP-like cAMP-binding protein
MATVVDLTPESLIGIRILVSLSPADRKAVVRQCQGRRYGPGEEIVHDQDRSNDVYLLVSGRVRATIYSVSGKEVAFRDLSAGQTFGDLSAIDGKPRSANVVAIEESMAAVMSASAFLDVLRNYSDVGIAVMRELTGMVRRLSERVVEFSTLGVTNRIHAELLRLAQPSPTGGGALIERPPTHAEIANRISTHREAVTKELNRLAAAGILEKRRGTLVITDLERLRRMVAEVKGE